MSHWLDKESTLYQYWHGQRRVPEGVSSSPGLGVDQKLFFQSTGKDLLHVAHVLHYTMHVWSHSWCYTHILTNQSDLINFIYTLYTLSVADGLHPAKLWQVLLSLLLLQIPAANCCNVAVRFFVIVASCTWNLAIVAPLKAAVLSTDKGHPLPLSLLNSYNS